METEDKKRQMPWVQNEKVVSSSTGTRNSNSTSTQKTDINVDLNDEVYQPVGVDYTPEKFKYDDQSEDGLLKQIGKYVKRPEFDKERAERLKRVARVNAFGDLMKHLGAFAGGGYAPTQKRQENQGVLRAFQELDKMRDLYDSRMDKYNNAMAGYVVADRNEALNRYNSDESRKLQLALAQAGYNKAAKDLQAGIETKRNTVSTNENVSKGTERSDGVKTSSKNMLAGMGGSGSGGKGDFVRLYAGPNDVIEVPRKSIEDPINLKSIFDTAKRFRGNIEYPKGKPIYGYIKDKEGKYVQDEEGNMIKDIIGYEPPSYEQVAEVISELIREIPQVRSVVADIAGIETDNRPGRQGQPSAKVKSGGNIPARPTGEGPDWREVVNGIPGNNRPSSGENKPTTHLEDLFKK